VLVLWVTVEIRIRVRVRVRASSGKKRPGTKCLEVVFRAASWSRRWWRMHADYVSVS